jgi:hypothetical protein
MRTLGKGMLLGAGLCAILLAGCDKKYNLTFVNATSQSREIELRTPYGEEDLGVANPAGKVHRTLKFKKDELPARCAWRAGDLKGEFTITDDMKKDIIIPIDALGPVGPIDKNTELHRKKQVEVKDRPVRQEEVVE